MAKIIDIPGTGQVEFPDSMSDDDIVKVIQQQNLALAKQVVQERPNTLKAKLALGYKEPETYTQYAGRSLKEMAIPMVTTAAGATLGLPGAMAGSAFGEYLNQTTGVHPRSVIPEANEPDMWRVGIAAAAPAIVPAVLKSAEVLKRAGKSVAENVKPIAMSNAWLRNKIGPYADDAANLLEKPSPLANYPQTAAEKLSGSPVGTVIQGHQQSVAQTPGGISTEFGKLKQFQDFALDEAAKRRDAIAGPMREQSLDVANAAFGVKARDILKPLNQQLAAPEIEGSPTSKKALESIKDHLTKMTDQYGRIDARALYQFKKEGIDQVIDTAVEKANPKFAERFRAKELIGVKQAIDDALDTASGGQWKPYLKEYSGRSAVIDALREARDTMYKPIQKTDLRGGVDIAPSAAHQILPPWLSRPVTTTKWLAEKYAGVIEPKIDRYMADLYQHPDRLAALLRSQSGQPSRYDLMVQELLKRQAPFAAGAATQVPR